MRSIAWVMLAITFGCIIFLLNYCMRVDTETFPSTAASRVAPVAPPVYESEAVQKLRAEAGKRGIRWMIYCEKGYNEEEGFTGFATVRGEENCYYEDEHPGKCHAWWGAMQIFPTQDAAAGALLRLIQRPPNVFPKRRPSEQMKKQCPPEISGE